MALAHILLALLLACAGSHAATITVGNIPDAIVNEWSDWVFFTASEVPNFTTQITISASPTTVVIENNVLSLTATPRVQQASFRIRATVPGLYVVSFELSTNLQFNNINTKNFDCRRRDTGIENVVNVIVGIPSERMYITLERPSTSPLTFTPSTTQPSRLSFQPAAVVIPAGETSGYFIYIASDTFSSAQITWTTTGAESELYNNLGSSSTFSSSIRSITSPALSQVVVVSNSTNALNLYVNTRVNGTLTIEPTAADTTFTPSSIELNDETQVASFSYVTTTPEDTKPVFYSISGSGAAHYLEIGGTMAVPKRSFIVNRPTSYTFKVKSKMTVRIPAPATGSVTVRLSATQMTLTPNELTFTGTVTSIAVDIEPTNIGSDSISFLVSGEDAAYYNVPNSVGVTIGGGSFLGPSDWYVPALWVGQESDEIPVWVNVPPPTEVVLTLAAPDVMFKPNKLVFDKNNVRQTFTITPLAGSTSSSETVQVSLLLNGADYAVYSAPSTFSVTIQRRLIQVAWSSHVLESSPYQLYLGKKYYVWVSANYVGKNDEVSVTPVNPYITFEPATAVFSSSKTRVRLVATVNAANIGTSSINYIIDGDDGGYYSSITAQSFTSSVRPLAIDSVAMTYDDRMIWGYVTSFSTSLVNAANVKSFLLKSYVIPDGSLTITPKCEHVEFSPSSITLDSSSFISEYEELDITSSIEWEGPRYHIEANFSTNAKAAGSHDVYFELSGSDGKYYDVPNHVTMLFRKYTHDGDSYASDSITSGAVEVVASFVFSMVLLCVVLL